MHAHDEKPPVDCDFDVAVVGAGPAGASAALTLARAGARVACLERESLPRYKTCGGGLVRRALHALPRGFEVPVERACMGVEMGFADAAGVFADVAGNSAVVAGGFARGGQRFVVRRDEAIVAMVMRAEFDHALVRAAVDAGAVLFAPCTLVGLETQADGVELATSVGHMRARFVVAADGALSATARLAGWTDRVSTIPALEAEVAVGAEAFERLRDTARFDLGTPTGGYGWIFPKRTHLSAGVLCMRRGSVDLRGELMRYLERAGAGAIESIEQHGYVIPIAPRSSFARGRVLLAGDAAGLADPLTGEGISYALHSGEIAARALLEGDFDPAEVRARQRTLLRATLLRELFVARWLAHVLYRRPKIAARLFQRSGQALCEAVTEVVLGHKSYRELALDPRNYFKLLTARSPS